MKCQYFRNSENCCTIGGTPIRACNPGLSLMNGLGVPGPENPQNCRFGQDYENGASKVYRLAHESPYFVKQIV